MKQADKPTTSNLIKSLQKLEPVFLEAGKLALSMQAHTKSSNKFDTGDEVIDIVTEADLAVQEFLLSKLVKTDLINCRLLAEEKTLGLDKFNPNGRHYLAIDPIDGTFNFARGQECFSTIITLHDGKDINYVFGYYPAYDWGYRIINRNLEEFGRRPTISVPDDGKNTIIHLADDPKDYLPEDIYAEVLSKGFIFKLAREFGEEIDRITLLLLDKVAGFCIQNINVYDGLTELAVSQARGDRIYSGGPDGYLDLSNVKLREFGYYYPGYYLTCK